MLRSATFDPRPRGEQPSDDAPALAGRWGRVVAFALSPRGRQITQVSRWILIAAVIALLVWQMQAIGWREIWTSLPRSPLFYLLFAVIYFQVSVGEIIAYRCCWSFDVRKAVPAFLIKRVYNRDVLGYSGEIYFFSWARRHLQLPATQIAETIRDQNIVSSIASTAIAVGLVVFYTVNGGLEVSIWLRAQLAAVATTWWVGAAFALLVATALVVRYRRFVFTMSLKIAAVILALHVVRLIVGQAVQILQWEVGAPEGAIEAWFTLSAASIVANRIPLLPGRDLLFVSAGVALSQSLEVGSAAVSGMLLVNAVLAKVLSFGLFVGLGMVERKQAPAGPEGEGAALSDPAPESPTPAADSSDGASAPP